MTANTICVAAFGLEGDAPALLAPIPERLREIQEISDVTQKEAAARAGIDPATVGYWLRGKPFTLENLDGYVRGLGGEVVLDLWHPKEDKRPVVTTKDGAEAATLVDALPGGPLDVGEADRAKVLRLLRVARELEPKDWRGIMNLVEAAEEEMARREVSDDRTARRR